MLGTEAQILFRMVLGTALGRTEITIEENRHRVPAAQKAVGNHDRAGGGFGDRGFCRGKGIQSQKHQT